MREHGFLERKGVSDQTSSVRDIRCGVVEGESSLVWGQVKGDPNPVAWIRFRYSPIDLQNRNGAIGLNPAHKMDLARVEG